MAQAGAGDVRTDEEEAGAGKEEVAGIVGQIRGLMETRYVFPEVGAQVSQVLATGVSSGRYPARLPALAAAVTADLQSVNGDKHLRLKYHDDAIPPRPANEDAGDRDAEEYDAMARWASQTCGGVACAARLAGNVGYLDVRPVLFPAVLCGDLMTAAMTLLASTDVLLVDLRGCLGGEPGMTTLLISYLCGRDPVQLTGLRERDEKQPRQTWTLSYVPGRRFGPDKPAYVLTSATTFSGAEQVSYDLQQLGRATIVGERTGGGANPREGFRVHPHLEATISVATAVHPRTGGSWEGTGVTPDVLIPAGQARDAAYRRALHDVIAAGRPAAAEAQEALAAALGVSAV